ncbi:hypothetical protein SAMN06295945_0404 [Polynucleobacter meluiroseus]|uniref:Amine oxidase domain-containing protein n=1 Tax=Polynucleobacter meluiroseus TaxID=1938814 RepID=A0A240DZI8_9BURK|nr:FAD-dependent oxidoreductase [Polynucleobacter meluiroseus]SNX28084.1 hypothetical protein SAMN06295945_0404 [Polynucleobacter meluiroseus]
MSLSKPSLIKKLPNIAVIGAGIAGLSCAAKLKEFGYAVEIFDKSRGTSGRMSTRRGEGWAADHGAQYFTARDPRFIKEVERWIQAEVLSLWQPHLKVYEEGHWRDSGSQDKRYVGIPEMTSPGKYIASNLSVRLNTTINQIERRADGWHIHSAESGEIPAIYDYVLIAVPAPQAEALAASHDQRIKNLAQSVHMQACWTVMARFEKKMDLPYDAAFINHERLSWICRNNSKPERVGLESWVIHATPQWSQKNVELTAEEATAELLRSAKSIGFDCQGAQTSAQRWRYASGSLDPSPVCHLSIEAHLGLCGDWLNGGRVEGAWLSGLELAHRLHLSHSSP